MSAAAARGVRRLAPPPPPPRPGQHRGPAADGRGEGRRDDHGAQRGEPQRRRRGAYHADDDVHEQVVGPVHGVRVGEQGEDLADRPGDRVPGVRLVPPERGPADLVSADHERGHRGNGDDQPVGPSWQALGLLRDGLPRLGRAAPRQPALGRLRHRCPFRAGSVAGGATATRLPKYVNMSRQDGEREGMRARRPGAVIISPPPARLTKIRGRRGGRRRGRRPFRRPVGRTLPRSAGRPRRSWPRPS